MTPHKRRYGRPVDLIVFADDIGRQMRVQSRAALRENLRAMINRLVRRIMQSAAVTLMTRLGYPAWIDPDAPSYPSMTLRRAQLFQHDLYKLLLAQPLKGIPIHFPIDSEITKPRKASE